ncbi:hypothetical protein Pan181_37450 [Aeoliella mucimassa]|uniref:Zinc ribbon domain protein n=1 Tax=Aeoliella mucimassa TaxID=2527972 RepID=A0A518AS23_9BACT|nr:hypothetical protein Pan181_37450 [Aeoliella mucimassa]
MVLKEYKCTRCGCRFEKEVFEEGEAERLVLPTAPVRCPECHSEYIEPGRILRHVARRM